MPSKQPALFNGVTQGSKQKGGGGGGGGEAWGSLGERGGCWRDKWGDAQGDECPRAPGVMMVVGVVGILPHTQ